MKLDLLAYACKPPATQEVEIKRITVWGKPRQKVRDSFWKAIKGRVKRTRVVAPVISKHKALHSNSSTIKKKKKNLVVKYKE
jgi:hypothetical protein